jgi:hypothetical protein
MSDSIVNCIVYKNADGSVQYYDVTFSFDGETIPSPCNHICIESSVLSNSTDLNEVKTLACAQASAFKAFYSNAEEIDDLNGPVDL